MNLILVGFMASGKTAVGRRLAKRLGYLFLDTDHLIEKELGRSIGSIFSDEGEPFFRRLESSLARNLSAVQNHVVSTGGGILTTAGNLELLQKAGLVIFLKADPEEIIKRLERDTRRPLLKKDELKEGDLRAMVEGLLKERLPQYSRSDCVIETKGMGLNRVTGEIIRLAGKRLGAERAAETANTAQGGE